ncbi:MAG TPA: thioesterase family protein [Dissulfurispiraceae bacterium]|nr:thioesterase family protein [Dissulfurispiraceae bacterium]
MSKWQIMENSRYEKIYKVEPADIDQLGHVNNIIYLKWVQDIAVAHWCTLTTPEQQSSTYWVVVRHEIDYRHPARLGDAVIARTWVGAAHGLHFERFTDILRTGDNDLLASARTVWCPIDSATGRPHRVAPEIRALFSTPEKQSGAS